MIKAKIFRILLCIFNKIITSLFICLKYANYPELSCKFSEKQSFRLYHSEETYLCLNSCAVLAWLLCRVLVLVKVGNKGFHLGQGQYEWGVFTSRFKTDISCLIPSLSWNKKAQKLSRSKEVFFLKSSPGEAWKGISAEGRQSSSGRFIEGTRFSRKDWPQHPWPAGRAAFSLPGAFVF